MILNKEVFKITTDKSQTCEAIKFYSPIAIQVSQTIIPENSIKIPDKIALNYIDDIQEAINKYKSELVTYIDDEQLSQNILSIIPSVEQYNKKIYGVANVKLKNQLTSKQIDDLKDYISGQYSDGWGEMFEQRDIQTKDGNINVEFWNYKNFYIQSEKELKSNTEEIDEAKEFKLYSPLNILTYYQEMDCTSFYTPVKAKRELKEFDLMDYMDYINEINESISNLKCEDIITNIDKELYEKITDVSVTIEKGRFDLCLVTEIDLKERLNDSEINRLKNCIIKKYNSLKKEINIDFYGDEEQINIDFSNRDDFFISTEEEFKSYYNEENGQQYMM